METLLGERLYHDILNNSTCSYICRYKGVPGYMAYDKPGYFRKITSVTQSVWVPNPIEMLYFDCKASLKNMSIAKLSDIIIDRDEVDQLIENPVTKKYDKIIKINTSEKRRSYDVNIDIEVQDSVILELDTAFKDIFESYPFTYSDWKSNKYDGVHTKDKNGFDFLECRINWKRFY